ncbi:TLC domain-containing protein 2-like [Amphiura filiformis]|uniref:TLC domain-containing protein 2-like n=1 Tax=Amphiura filiformis TaxID=82378 RepID=UPI003B20C8AD
MFNPTGVCAILISYLSFTKFSQILKGKSSFIPVPAKYAGPTRYKWSNVVGSFVHAIIVAVLGCYCFYATPEYLKDRVTTYTTLGEVITGIFAGYTIYDTVDLLKYQGFSATWPVLVHHILLTYIGVGYFLYHHYFQGYLILACFAEINSIFLHGRMLLLMYGTPKNSLLFKVNNAVNICSFLTCRLGSFTVLMFLLHEDCNATSSLWCCGINLFSLILFGISVVLLCRVLRSDFLSRRKDTNVDEDDVIINNNANSTKSE